MTIFKKNRLKAEHKRLSQYLKNWTGPSPDFIARVCHYILDEYYLVRHNGWRFPNLFKICASANFFTHVLPTFKSGSSNLGPIIVDDYGTLRTIKFIDFISDNMGVQDMPNDKFLLYSFLKGFPLDRKWAVGTTFLILDSDSVENLLDEN